jgi:MSHA biogenesis protein MshP
MCPNSLSNKYSQRGIGLPATIFIITVLALIVVAMAELNQSSNQAFAQSFQSQKAFYAAESGAQIALNRVFVGAVACNNSIADINFSSAGAGLESCTADLSCNQVTVSGINYYTISSAATCGTGFETSQRSIQVRASSD